MESILGSNSYGYVDNGGFPIVFTASGKEPACQCRIRKRLMFDPWVGKIPWRRKWQPTPVFLPGEFHGQRSLADYNPWGCKESDTTERLNNNNWLVCDCCGFSSRSWLWLWFACLSILQGGSLPCNLNSLMGSWKGTNFQFVYLLAVRTGATTFKLFTCWSWNQKSP